MFTEMVVCAPLLSLTCRLSCTELASGAAEAVQLATTDAPLGEPASAPEAVSN